ncbi:MAG: trypsin-like peptidase domain-containing protein, partial [Phycisphaerales bacterium]|nr:trypsin-like peptidase domain-containing protein [Phycisphaerales bacterium]
FGGPMAIRTVISAQTKADVQQAANRLAGDNILAEFSSASRDIATIVEPSVVHVSTEGRLEVTGRGRRYASTGSGWIWDELGHVITNAHVIDGADQIEIQLYNGEVRPAEVVGLDLRSDIAVLKIPAGNLIAARRSDSRVLQQGDLVFTFGSPFDFRFSMSSGIISGLGRAAGLDDIDYENFIQVDAAINPGNSGGPLTDVYGRVVGMNTAIATGRGSTVGQGQFAGIGLAIPMAMIEFVASQVIETGVIRKGFMGVSLREARAMDALRFDARVNATFEGYVDAIAEFYDGEGVVVTMVAKDTPAERAGIRLGDIIERIEGRRVRGLEQLKSMISSRMPGQETSISLWRWDPQTGKAERMVVSITLGELRSEDFSPAASLLIRLGVTGMQRSSPEAAASLGVEHVRGVLVTSASQGSPLGRFLPVGSIIIEVDGRRVGSVDEIHARIDRVFMNNGRVAPRRGPFPITARIPDGSEVTVDLTDL